MIETFEDRGRTMREIISLFFETLYIWTAAFVYGLACAKDGPPSPVQKIANNFFLKIK
jgi:hypothetical protein